MNIFGNEVGSVVLIALVAALFWTVEKTVDSVISNNYAIAPDPKDKLTAASAYLLVGAWIGMFISLGMALVLGPQFPKHQGIAMPALSPSAMAIAAGAASAVATLIFLWANMHYDLSIMGSLSGIYVLFVVAFEWLTGKVQFTAFLPSTLLTVLGMGLVAYSPKQNGEENSISAYVRILFIVLIMSGALAFNHLIIKPAVDNGDPVNVQLVRFGSLVLVGTFMVIVWSSLRGKLQDLFSASAKLITTPAAIVWLFVLFGAVFLGQVFELWAKKENVDVSSVTIVLSLSIGLAFLTSLVVDKIKPGYVGEVPKSWKQRGIRLIGVSVLMAAVVLL